MWCLANNLGEKLKLLYVSIQIKRKYISNLIFSIAVIKCLILRNDGPHSLIEQTSACLHDNSAYEADKRVSSLNSIDRQVHRLCLRRKLNEC